MCTRLVCSSKRMFVALCNRKRRPAKGSSRKPVGGFMSVIASKFGGCGKVAEPWGGGTAVDKVLGCS